MAIVVAVTAVLLLSIAALGVDLGNAYVQRHSVQKLTDFAALAGGAGNNLPGTAPGTCDYGKRAQPSDQAVVDVAAYLGSAPWTGGPTPADLVDCQTSNGEVFYGTVTPSATNPSGVALSFDAHQLTVVSPQRQVDFGFARIMGFENTQVVGRATIELRSPTVRSVPLYAFSGCDYGGQTIAQPNHGHSVAGVLLSHPTETNAADLTSLVTSPVTDPATIAYPAPEPSSLGINGSGLTNVTAVGFFESGATTSGPEPVVVGSGGFTISGGGSRIDIPDIPDAALDVQGVWYIRVKIGDDWSRVKTSSGTLKALPLTVGTPTLTCGQGSSEGNFGSLLLDNSEVNGQWQDIAMNIADGLEHTLAVFPDAAADWTCSSSQTQAVLWPEDGTNCVDTRTGMVANAAQAGLVDGIGSVPGKLTNVSPGTGCASSGAPATTVVGGRTINNDTLSCFFEDDGTNIGMVNSPLYTQPGPVISAAIFKSPRFVIVPVLGRQPDNGGSLRYQITGFRPAFITDQTASSTKSTPPTASNGLSTDKHDDIESVQVVFINSQALPPMESSETTVYSGSGPKVVHLVD